MADATRPHVIQVRLSDEEKQFLDASVAAAGLRRSEYVRRVLGGTSLGRHVVGKVERSGDGRQRGGVVAEIRPALKGGADLSRYPVTPGRSVAGRCSDCGSPGAHQKWCVRVKR